MRDGQGAPDRRGDHRPMQGGRPDGRPGDRPQGQRPFGDRNQGGRPGDRRPGMGGLGGFGDKDKDDDTRRTFPSKRPSKPSPDSQLKSDLGTQIGKNDRAGKLKNKGKDKKDKRDYDDEMQNLKKDPNRKGAFQKPVKQVVKEEEDIKVITIPEVITIKELADKMKQNAGAIVKKLFLAGKMINQNSEITFEEAEEIALDYEIMCEKEAKVNIIEELLKETEEDPETLVKRPPVVCVMGHVDHGKTSLLDAIRSTNVTAREAGGITQHIGAYMVEINGEKITFLDTPGHEAFTSMRMRGAKSTDIAILVVAADDGVMPQTIEAINHAKAANTEIIVAINKIDKPGANIDKVKQELSNYELIPEEWGGSTIMVPVSAKQGTGIDDLLEMVLLTADVLELKADPTAQAKGTVIEAKLDKNRGPVATVLVQQGTLKHGSSVVCGAMLGNVRAMYDDKGAEIKKAGPSIPVEILGLPEVPEAGETFYDVTGKDDKVVRQLVEKRKIKQREEHIHKSSRMSLETLAANIAAGDVKDLNLIVKADVQGSVEAVIQSLEKLSNDEVRVKVIHGAVGAINESDVTLADVSDAIIIGFNVRPNAIITEMAKEVNVDIRLYSVIYNAIEDVEKAMKGMLAPTLEEAVLGHVEIRELFKVSGVGTIGGSYVLDGKITRNSNVRVVRDDVVVYTGHLGSLQRMKDAVKEVNSGYECGLSIENYNDIKIGDIIEAYEIREVARD